MKEVIIILQILISLFLVTTILLQAKGTGLGQAWGGGGEFYRSKRGVEKLLLKLTVILAVLFFISSSILSVI